MAQSVETRGRQYLGALYLIGRYVKNPIGRLSVEWRGEWHLALQFCHAETKYNNVTTSILDAANHPAPQEHAEFMPECFPRPVARTYAKTHFPPRPRKTASHSDDENWATGRATN